MPTDSFAAARSDGGPRNPPRRGRTRRAVHRRAERTVRVFRSAETSGVRRQVRLEQASGRTAPVHGQTVARKAGRRRSERAAAKTAALRGRPRDRRLFPLKTIYAQIKSMKNGEKYIIFLIFHCIIGLNGVYYSCFCTRVGESSAVGPDMPTRGALRDKATDPTAKGCS